jgi:hypothetical protein
MACRGLTTLPTIFRSISENKVGNRQIAQVSDFEIKVVIDNESDFVTESLDR